MPRKIAQTIFNKDTIENYRGEDLRDIFTTKVLASKLLLDAWDRVSENIDSTSLSKVLLRIIINKWVNIRANSFADAWVNIIKLKYRDAASSKVEPCMRKTLK